MIMHSKFKSYVNININTAVEVKLTELGMTILTNHYFKYFAETGIKNTKLYINGLINKKGYIRFSMWDFMSIFGKNMHMGSYPVIENNDMKIYLEG